jgi:hypothetical protein
MKKLFISVILLLTLVVYLPAVANTTSCTPGTGKTAKFTDATGGWWYAATTNYARQVVTIDYVAGTCTSITLIAGVRFKNEAGLISTVTYRVPIISSAGAATYDPITISAAGSYVFTVGVPQSADWLYISVAYTDGADATVNINQAPDIAF